MNSWPGDHGPYCLGLLGDQAERLVAYLTGVRRLRFRRKTSEPYVPAIPCLPINESTSSPTPGRWFLSRQATTGSSFAALTCRRPGARRASPAGPSPRARPQRPRGHHVALRLRAQTDRGNPEYRLGAGPPGMTIDSHGLFTGPVPADCADGAVDVPLQAAARAAQSCPRTFGAARRRKRSRDGSLSLEGTMAEAADRDVPSHIGPQVRGPEPLECLAFWVGPGPRQPLVRSSCGAFF
jgi:hypothetical protein